MSAAFQEQEDALTLSVDVAQSFTSIHGDIRKVAEMVGGIAQATEELGKGVTGCTQAMQSVDRDVQVVATASEEVSSTAGNLHEYAQAVCKLHAFVG